MPKKPKNSNLSKHDSSTAEAESLSDEFGWRIFRIMAEFVDGFQLIRGLKNTVSFFGSARVKEGDKHYQEAHELALMLGKAGFTIVTGGGPGIMEAGNRGAFESGAESVGLNIQLPSEQRINPYVKKALGFHYFFTRKVMLSYAAQAYVFFPGGYGTLNELTELITLVQTKKIDPIPIILIGRDFWGSFIDWIRRNMLVEHHHISEEDLKIVRLAKDVKEAFEIIQCVKHNPEHPAKMLRGFQD